MRFGFLVALSTFLFRVVRFLSRKHLQSKFGADACVLLSGVTSSLPLLACNEREQMFIKLVIYTRVIEVLKNGLVNGLDLNLADNGLNSSLAFILVTTTLGINLYFERRNLPDQYVKAI